MTAFRSPGMFLGSPQAGKYTTISQQGSVSDWEDKIWSAHHIFARGFKGTEEELKAYRAFVVCAARLSSINRYHNAEFFIQQNYPTITPDLNDPTTYKIVDQNDLFEWSMRYRNDVMAKEGKPMFNYNYLRTKYDLSKMTKSYWGPRVWDTMHALSLGVNEDPNLSEDDFLHYKAFISSLGFILPCAECKGHFIKNMVEIPIDKYCAGKRGAFEWCYKMHAKVTEQLKKEPIKWTETCNKFGCYYS